MDNFYIIIWLLPILFMVHDFEEIIFFKPWIEKNGTHIEAKYPFVAKYILSKIGKLSVSAFSLAVFEEFVLLSLITVIAVLTHYYNIWFAAFMAFSIHILVHIVQWIIIRKYIPAITTSLLILPYCIYGFIFILNNKLFSNPEMILWSTIGIIFMVINLIFVHRLAEEFDKKFRIKSLYTKSIS